MPNVNKTIFAISGSLRSGSSNHNILLFLQNLTPAGIDFIIYDELAQIPPFDPANDNENVVDTIIDFRKQIETADAVIICTPEYAHGIPGQLKNALDWTVSSGSFSNKPTSLITASTDGINGHAALLEVLKTIDASLTDDTTLLISFVRSKIDNVGNIVDANTADELKAVFNTLLSRID